MPWTNVSECPTDDWIIKFRQTSVACFAIAGRATPCSTSVGCLAPAMPTPQKYDVRDPEWNKSNADEVEVATNRCGECK
jgi:hypothetical protein